jgi:hypothetical protein
MAKERISIIKGYDILTVFDENSEKIHEESPQTTDSSAVENVLNNNKTVVWDFKLISIAVSVGQITIYSTVLPSEEQEFEQLYILDFTAEEQTIINNFLSLL